MKKIFVLICAAAMMSSCGLLGSMSKPVSSEPAQQAVAAPSTASEAGKGAGTALQALYKQYKADGKYDYTNLTNAINTIQLIQYCQDLKSHTKDAAYRKEFNQGLMASAVGLIDQRNVDIVTDNLTTLATQYADKVNEQAAAAADKAAQATTNVADKLNTAAQAANSVTTLLNMFKK